MTGKISEDVDAAITDTMKFAAEDGGANKAPLATQFKTYLKSYFDAIYLAASATAAAATKLATARNIDGQAFDGTAAITVIAPATHAATSKTTPVDADEIGIVDSAASNVLAKLTWANLKATLKTYLDSLYAPGSWVAYTPTVSAGTGTFTTVSASGAYIQLGKTIFVRLNVTITTNGTAASNVQATLPVAAKSGVNQALFGTESAFTAATLQGIISNTVVIMRKLDASYPGANGYSLNLNGSYEAA